MEFFRKNKRLNSRALQVRRQRLHLSATVRQMSVANPRHDEPAALDSNLQPSEIIGGVPQQIVGAIQAVEPMGMVLLIQSFRTEQQMQASQRAMNFIGFLIGGGRLRRGSAI
jgi:hypothetical protein